MGITNFSHRSIGSYLQENVYYIPDYQRGYSWEGGNEVEDFWNDLQSVIKEGRDQHFFGQVVIHKSSEDGKYYIIDGQQRTTTSVIFLSALSQLFEKIYTEHKYMAAKNRTEDIRLKYIGRWSEEEDGLRLYLGKSNREYFRNNIQVGSPKKSNTETKSNAKIREAYEYFMDKLSEKIGNLDGGEKKYKEIYKYYHTFIEFFKVMYVETDDLNEAFIIFETLNARGKDLETSDLLKNHLFRLSGNKIDQIKDKWQQMIRNLDKIDTTKFIRHYWNSREDFSTERYLYKRMRENVRSSRKCEEIMDDLLELSEVYRALYYADEERFYTNAELNLALSNLKTVNARTFYPIILAMQKVGYSEKEMAQVVKAIESLIVRNCVIAGKVANKYEKLFAKIAYKISNFKYDSINDIVCRIKMDTINDEVFLNAFNVYSDGGKTTIRFILKSINCFVDGETTVIDDNQKVHIEHIMPVKKGAWEVSDEDHDEYLNRIGNLTLLGSEYNKKISNKRFDEKKEIYQTSSILITKDIVNYTHWDVDTIKDRQNKLANIAVKIW